MRRKFSLPLVTLGLATIVGIATAPASSALSAPTSGDPALISAAQAQ